MNYGRWYPSLVNPSTTAGRLRGQSRCGTSFSSRSTSPSRGQNSQDGPGFGPTFKDRNDDYKTPVHQVVDRQMAAAGERRPATVPRLHLLQRPRLHAAAGPGAFKTRPAQPTDEAVWTFAGSYDQETRPGRIWASRGGVLQAFKPGRKTVFGFRGLNLLALCSYQPGTSAGAGLFAGLSF